MWDKTNNYQLRRAVIITGTHSGHKTYILRIRKNKGSYWPFTLNCWHFSINVCC